jgi:hypothetical protein
MSDTNNTVKILEEHVVLKEYIRRTGSLLREINDTPSKNWFFRYYPKKKYIALVDDILDSNASRHLLRYISREYPREFLYEGWKEKWLLRCAHSCISLRICDMGLQLRVNHQKKLLNFSKCLEDRFVQDSPVFRDNPIDTEVIHKIASYCVVSFENMLMNCDK